MAESRERPVVAMCAGKDCRSRCEFATMRRALDNDCHIVDVKCVGICAGPVVVARTHDRPLVFAKLRTKKERRALLRFIIDDTRPSSALSKREVGGSKRKATLRRVEQTLGRSA